MKYLLFDQSAISTFVGDYTLQSIEFSQAKRLIQHVRGELMSEIFRNVIVEHTKYGVLFVGRKEQIDFSGGHKVFCIDLIGCPILQENPSDLLTILQKAFRLTIKIWERQPFSSSERYNKTKSILFPFSKPDHRRLVIERSNNILRLEKRGIIHPLLAYKYNASNPTQTEDVVDTSVLRKSSEDYLTQYISLQRKFDARNEVTEQKDKPLIMQIKSSEHDKRDDFIYWDFERQYSNLTDSQRSVVDYDSTQIPLRIEGAAGTGKTFSMIMRAYRMLRGHRAKHLPFKIVFFSHSASTCERNRAIFELYSDSSIFLDKDYDQSIFFVTLLDYCRDAANIREVSLIEQDAFEAKNYQLFLISEVVQKAVSNNRIKTYRPLLSSGVNDLFDPKKTNPNSLYQMLQHEFSIQIKGRTNCTFEGYCDINPIPNGIPCAEKKDKELIFSLFNDYQKNLQNIGSFDVDDVTVEALSRLNAPIWRRRRKEEGYDYIFADEMHLFNINEQSVFHYLTKDFENKDVPICFALDYGQAIGDRGNVRQDYIETAFGKTVEGKKLRTLFRNAPPIADFCVSIATAGTLMFGQDFSNPYNEYQNTFTNEDDNNKSFIPQLYMYNNDDEMIEHLDFHIGEIMKALQCRASEIAVISFDDNLLSDEGIKKIRKCSRRKFAIQETLKRSEKDTISLASPYMVNGLEFQAVILLGADEGRVPQNAGTSDISQHFIRYSAYNMLYLTASRAKYIIRILGSKLNGISTCLEHSIQNNCLKQVE